MLSIRSSIFWNKAITVVGNPSLGDIAASQDKVHLFRTIARYSMLEGIFQVTSEQEAYLLDSLTLRLLDVTCSNLSIASSQIKKHITKAYDTQSSPPFVEICTITSCTRRCKSCIQGHMNLVEKTMSRDVWIECVNQLGKLFRSDSIQKPVVHLHWYNEPLKDPTLTSKVEDLRQHGIDTIVLITNGDLLSPFILDVLSDLCMIVIVCAKSREVFERYKQYNELSCNIACVDHSHFHDNIQGFNRCGSTYRSETLMSTKCKKGLNINIDYNGDVYLCCNDMSKMFSPGNILQDRIIDIWRSEQLCNIQRELMSTGYSGAPCASCAYRECVAPYVSKLIKKENQ